MTAPDRDSLATIDYLRAQPRGAVLRWATHHLTAEQPWSTGWVDVSIPEDGPPDMGWVWTILDPDDPEQGSPEQLWQFPWPQDLDVHGVFDPGHGWYVDELPIPAEHQLPDGLVEAYRRAAARIEEAYRSGDTSARPVGAALYERLTSGAGSAYHVRSG